MAWVPLILSALFSVALWSLARALCLLSFCLIGRVAQAIAQSTGDELKRRQNFNNIIMRWRARALRHRVR